VEPPPVHQPEFQNEPSSQSSNTYETVADVVGFVPNLRKQDNVFQAKFIATTVLLACLIGAIAFAATGSGPWWAGMVLGLLGGLLAGLLLSGVILAIRNLKRNL
jgi:fatty acid desaturase